MPDLDTSTLAWDPHPSLRDLVAARHAAHAERISTTPKGVAELALDRTLMAIQGLEGADREAVLNRVAREMIAIPDFVDEPAPLAG